MGCWRSPLPWGLFLLLLLLGSPGCLGLPPPEFVVHGERLTAEKVCSGGGGGVACHSHVLTRSNGARAAFASPPTPFIGALDIQAAYSIPPGLGANATVGIVYWYDHPTVEQDLATYRARYGLPPCTSCNGCFRKVNQNGDPLPLPVANSNSALVISLDTQMVSAACPLCKILLVEANQPTYWDVLDAEKMAVKLGATVVSNSWGGQDDAGNPLEDPADPFCSLKAPVPLFFSSGYGFHPSTPATCPGVIAVGGTQLFPNNATARKWTERAYVDSKGSGAGCGCSQYIDKPPFQTDGGCSKRTIADVSAVAYHQVLVVVNGAWSIMGGTGAAAPIVAAIVASSGIKMLSASWFYSHGSTLYDVVGGSVGTCSPAYLCTAVAGYDGPTGMGSPNLRAMIAAPAQKVDCSGSFSAFTSCTKVCGGGLRTEIYTVFTSAQNGGKACPYSQGFVKNYTCNTVPCAATAVEICSLSSTNRSTGALIATRKAEYSNDTNCATVIRAPVGYYVSFVIDGLCTEATFDFLIFKDGEGPNAVVLSQLTGCGSTPAPAVNSVSNVATVLFTSDSYVQYSGFQLKWSFKARPCNVKLTGLPSGLPDTFAFVGWANGKPAYLGAYSTYSLWWTVPKKVWLVSAGQAASSGYAYHRNDTATPEKTSARGWYIATSGRWVLSTTALATCTASSTGSVVPVALP